MVDIDKVVDSLTGCIPDEGMTLDDYRSERLEKFFSLAGNVEIDEDAEWELRECSAAGGLNERSSTNHF